MTPRLQPRVPPPKSLASLLVWLGTGFVFIFAGAAGGVNVYMALATGYIYSIGVLAGDGAKIGRSSSPTGFWIMIIIFSCSFVLGSGLGLKQIVVISGKIAKRLYSSRSSES
jgi:hypothetical protein